MIPGLPAPAFSFRARLAVAALLFALPAAAADYTLTRREAPDFALRAFSGGQNVRLSEWRGQVVLLSFWSSRCNTCRGQLAELERLHRTYHAAGLEVFAISIDDDDEAAREFATGVGVGFPMLADPEKAVGRDYRIDVLPTMVLVDRSGVIKGAWRDRRSRDRALYLRALRRALDE